MALAWRHTKNITVLIWIQTWQHLPLEESSPSFSCYIFFKANYHQIIDIGSSLPLSNAVISAFWSPVTLDFLALELPCLLFQSSHFLDFLYVQSWSLYQPQLVHSVLHTVMGWAFSEHILSVLNYFSKNPSMQQPFIQNACHQNFVEFQIFQVSERWTVA